jgi:hypothetical protein
MGHDTGSAVDLSSEGQQVILIGRPLGLESEAVSKLVAGHGQILKGL